MSAIRVFQLQEDITDRELKIHFSKPEHGGGSIRSIYYPLLNNDAVVIFKHDTSKYMIQARL